MKKSFNLGSIVINLSKNMAVYLIATIILLAMTSSNCYGQSPEILVEGGSPLLEIIDGDNTPDTADDTDFGAIADGSSDTHTFTISNTDLGDLTIDANGIIINTATAGVFTLGTVSETLPHTLAQNETMTFDVIFTPNASGTSFSGSVQIENNDSDEDPYDFNIQGTGEYTWVELSISPELGATTCFCDGNQSLIVTDNFFDSSLSLNGVDNTGAFTLSVTQPMRLENMLANGANNGDNWTVTAVGGSWTSFGPESSTTGEDLSLALIDENNLNGGVSNSAVEFLFTKLDATGGGLRLFYALEACPVSSNTSEINVQGNSTSITNGDSTPDVADSTDFGNVDLSMNKSITYTIENTGVIDLILNGSPIVAVSGTNASEFIITSQALSPVSANGGNTTFTIEFTPGALGLRTATVSISNNDCDEDPYTFDIQGTGINAAAALHFDGSNWIEVSPNPIPNVTNLTFEAWCKPSAMDDWGRIIGSPSNLRNLQAKTSTENKFSFYPVANGAFVPAVAPNPWVVGQWYHVAGVIDGTSVKLYIDGELVATTMITDPLDNDMSTLYIGRSHIVGEELTGELDEVRIWSVARTCEEINHYKDCELTGTETDLVAYYQFNQGIASGTNTSETTLNDQTANNNDGALTNFTLTGSTSNWVAPSGVTSGDSCIGTPMYPEMVIEGGSTPTEIANGDTTPDTADNTDFGTHTINSNTDYTFTIKNTGTDVLNLSGNQIVAISGDSEFTILTQPSNSMIASGGSDLTFVVRYTPTTEATHSASISIANDDCDENPYIFDIQGTGVEVASALDFTGSNDYIDLGTDPFEFVGDFTIETWVNHNSSDGRIMDKGVSGGEGPVLDLHGGIRFISADGGNGQYTITAPDTVPSNVWTHLALSIDVTNLIATYYVGGVVVHTAAIPGDVAPNPTLNMTLGAHLNGSSNFDGKLDEFRVWSDVRTCAEIASNKDCELTGTEDNLALYYNFNQGIASGNNTSETTLIDNVGNGNDGTLVNFALAGNSSNWISPGGMANGNTCSGTSIFPEIAIEGGSTPTEIANGDTTPDTTDDTDFGTQTTNTNTDHTFTIKNTGTEILNLSGNPIVAISGDSEFTILTQPSSSMIASGGSDLTFVVRYAPTAEATHSATISIVNNDCDEDPYTFNVQGTGAGSPEIDIQGNGASIVDGDASPDASDDTDFGSLCNGESTSKTFTINNTGSIDLTISSIVDDHVDYTISGAPSEIGAGMSETFTVNFTGNTDGLQTATITISNNDADENPFTFNVQTLVNPLPTAGLSADMTTICAGEEVTFTATGGTMYEFFLNGMSQGAASSTATFASSALVDADVVSVTVTDANGCADTNVGITMTANPNPTAGLSANMTTICTGEEVTFTATGGTMYEFFINNVSQGAASATTTFASTTLVNSDVVSVTVTDANGCIDSHSGINITVNPNPIAGLSADMTTICTGEETTFTATGGTMYEFFVDGFSVQGPSAAASYSSTGLLDQEIITVEVTDVNGCTDTHAGISITVNENPVYNSVTVNCTGGTLDDVVVNATIGSGTLEYNVDGGMYQVSNTFTGLSQGDHTFDIRESTTLCSVSSGVQMISCDCPTITMNTIAADQTICAGESTIMLDGATAVTNPVTPFDYQWQSSSSGANTFTNIATATNEDYDAGSPSASTDYRRLVMVSGCPDDISNITTITVNPNPTAGLSADMTTICAGEEVTFTATGGTMYEFFINGMSQGAASATVTFASTSLGNSDVVSVEVTDANGCIVSHSGITITVNPNPTAGLSADMTTICSGEEVTFTATGSTMYEFLINGMSQGAASATASFASTTLTSSDVVTVTVTDANGCTDTHAGITMTVNENPIYTSVTVNCTGGTLDDVVVNATIGSGILEYNVDGGMYQVSNTFTGLSQGDHTFNIRESTTLCSVSSGVQMISCDCPTITMNTIAADQTICAGESTTMLDGATAVTSPVTPFDYQWQSSPSGANTFTNIATATNEDYDAVSPSASTDYRRLVMVSGCPDDISNITTITVNPNPTAGLSADMTTICAGEEATFTATGGTMYEFFVNGMSQGAASAAATFASTTLVNSDVVSVTVTDANGCTDTHAGITVTVNPNPTAGLSADMTEICIGEDVTFTASGGTMYEFLINGSSVQGPSTSTVYSTSSLIDQDIVTVMVMASNSCSSISSGITITVNPNPIPIINSSASELNCSTTTIMLDGSSSTGQGILNYLWSDGSNDAAIIISDPGLYLLTITDGNTCSASSSIMVIEDIDEPTVDINSGGITEISCLQPNINLDASGSAGQGSLSYLWSTGDVTSHIDVSTASIYTVTITDSDNSCTSEASIEITGNTINPTAIINSGGINILTCAQPSITLNAGVSTGQGSLSYLWSTGETTASINATMEGNYSVTITEDSNSCTDIADIDIIQDVDLPMIVINSGGISELNCNQTTITLDGSGSSGMGTISYLWSTGETTSDISISIPNTYGLTITDNSNGCTAESSVIITQDILSPNAMAIPDFTELNCSTTSITIDGSGSIGQGAISYLWSTGSTMSSIDVISPDSYDLTITDSDNGCTDVITVNISEDVLEPMADISSTTTELTCQITNIILDGTNSSGQGSLSYLWSTGETTSVINITSADTYSLTVTDADNSCFNTTSIIISEDISMPTATITSPLTELNCTTTTIPLDGSSSMGQGTLSYLWSTGETTATINVSLPNTYNLTITDSDNNCIAETSQIITQDILVPTAVIDASDPAFTCVINSITLDASMSMGQSSLSYLWSTGETSASIEVTQVNAYTVTITDADNGCTSEETINLSLDNASPTITVVPSDTELNCLITSITLDANSSVGQGAISYLWSTGETTSTIDVTSPNVYGLTITDSQNGCVNTTSTAISQDINVPDATIISSTIELNCTNTSITLDGSNSSGQGSLTYLWSTGETTASIMVTNADTYELTITDSDNGCTDVASQIITENNIQPVAEINSNSTELTCILTNITLDASNSSGQGMISYLWSTGATTATISVTNIGVYSLTITDDANDCTQIDEVTITEDILAPTAAISSSDPELNCSILSISLDASSSVVQGTPSYIWNTGETTASIDVNTPSNYSVIVMDSDNGCVDVIDIDINENANIPSASITSATTELNCIDTNITLDGSNSTSQGALTYLWSTGETTSTIDVNTTGEYGLTITDVANDCTDETTINITEDIVTPTLIIIPSESEFNCIVSTINLDAGTSTGQGTLAYLWSTGETTSDIDVMTTGGYTVTITDSDNGCVTEETITLGENITNPTASISSGGVTEITCAQNLITLDASGSTGQDVLTYLWSTGSTDPTIDITMGGTYTVTISDSANGCEDQSEIIITQDIVAPTAQIQASDDELTCTILTSTLDASGSTGQGTISYEWSTGETTPAITVNAANDYTVTVTDDDNGCTDEITFTLGQDIMGFTADVIPTATEFTCDVTSIDIDASGSSGQGTLTYLWSTGETSSVITVTTPDTYTVTITDGNNGCEIIQGTTLTENILQPTVMSDLSADELNCTITSISIDASGSTGQGTLTYLWSTGETTNTIDVNTPDDYGVTVTDSANGCSNNSMITVTQNIDVPTVNLASSADNITCDVTEVFLDASGSTSSGTLSYLWSTGETTDLISVSAAGTYTVTLTDDNSTCTEVEMIVVGENTAIPTANISSSSTELNCLDLSLELDASGSTGQGTLSYSWNTGETTATIDVTTADIFTVTITDAENGCIDEANITITEDVLQPIADISSPSTIITCTDIMLTLDGNGSSGQGTLSYLWSTGETSATIEVNTSGNYELTVTDSDNGCTSTTALNITENIVDPTATINSGGNTELSCDQPIITLNGSNSTGQGSLSYLWSTGEMSAAIDVTMAGIYDLTVTDGANGCTNASSITITQNVDLPMADINALATELTCDIESIILDGSGSTAQGTIDYVWSTGETSATITVLEANIYELTITDSSNGCTNATVFEVTQNITEPDGTLAASATEINCETSTISLDVSGYIGQGTLSYLWSTGETAATIDVTEANLYEVSITDDANGCMTITSQAITENISMPNAIIDAPITELTCQNTMITLNGVASMGQGSLTYLWSTGESGASIVVDAADSYGLTVTDDSNGCSQETSITITQDENVPVINMIPSGTELTCVITDITLDASSSMGQGDLTFLWSTGETGESISTNTAGTYSLTITDSSNGCTSEQSQEIEENTTLPTALITNATSALSCADENIVLNGAESISQGTISYLWSTSETTASIIISEAGAYGLTITDAANGCTAETSIEIDENITNPVSAINASAMELTCTLTGITIDASASTGQGTLMYTWSTGEFSEFIDVVGPGDYTVTVTDSTNGCTSESSVTITQNIEGLNLSLTSTNSELNCDVTSIVLDASGTTGLGTLGFLWSTGETSSSITVSTPDMYSVTITDQQNGCEVIGQETITEDISEPIITYINLESICFNAMPVGINPMPIGGLLTGSGIIGTVFDPSVAGVGLHSLQYSFTGLNGCSKDSSFTIEVLAAPEPNIIGETSYCSGSELVLMENSGTGDNWTWTGPNGFASIEQSISIDDLQLINAGTYTVEITNPEGCSASLDIEVSLDLSPTITLEGAMEACEGENINIAETGGDAISWTWTGPNGFNESGDMISLAESDANDSGKYYLEIENSEGCIHLDSFDLIVNALPSVILTSNDPICEGGDLELMESGGEGINYNWTGPGGFSSMVQNPTIANVISDNSGIYYLAIRDDNLCINEDSIEIMVNTNPIITVMSSSPICNGEDLELSETGGDAISWAWTDPNGNSYTDQDLVVSNSDVVLGNYNLEITDVNGCTASLDTMVTSASGEDIETNFLIGAFACVGDTIRFIDYSVIDSTTMVDFFWDFGNGDTSTDRDPMYIYSEGGLYDVNLEITNGECPNVSISKTLDVAQCRLEEEVLVDVNAYPTISTGSFNVELKSEEDLDMVVQVVSTEGELVYYKYIEDALEQINLEIDILQTGIYTLIVRHNYGKEVRRIVIVR